MRWTLHTGGCLKLSLDLSTDLISPVVQKSFHACPTGGPENEQTDSFVVVQASNGARSQLCGRADHNGAVLRVQVWDKTIMVIVKDWGLM